LTVSDGMERAKLSMWCRRLVQIQKRRVQLF
jgi:hypothetical protein